MSSDKEELLSQIDALKYSFKYFCDDFEEEINSIINQIEEHIADEPRADDADSDMLTVTGAQFKKLLNLGKVTTLAGAIYDHSTCHNQETMYLNASNKIRPPVGFIKDDHICEIADIRINDDRAERNLDFDDVKDFVAKFL